MLERFWARDHRALAKIISIVENDDPGRDHLIGQIFPGAGRAYILGVTGSPGTGKSSLVDRLIGGMDVRDQPALDQCDWPEIRRIKASNNTAWRYFEGLVKTMNKIIGEEKTGRILSQLMVENARRYIVPAMKSFGITGNDPWSLASYFKLATGEVLGYKTELMEESPKKVIYRIYPPCLWFPDLDIPPDFCRCLGQFEVEAARMVNPKIKVRFEKIMTAGDPYCELVFEEV